MYNKKNQGQDMKKFDWPAEKYHKSAQFQFTFAQDVLTNLNVIEPIDRVLDVGSGAGRTTAYIASDLARHGSVHGIDASANMVAFAQEAYPKTSYLNLKFEMLNVEDMSYKNCYEVAVSFFAVQWFKDQKKCIQNIYNALVPGGKMLLCAPYYNTLSNKMIFDVARRSHWQEYFHGNDRHFLYGLDAHLENFVAQSGFSQSEVQKHTKDINRGSYTDLLQRFKTYLPLVRYLPEDKQDEYVGEMITYGRELGYIKQKSEDNYYVTKDLLVLIAHKSC